METETGQTLGVYGQQHCDNRMTSNSENSVQHEDDTETQQLLSTAVITFLAQHCGSDHKSSTHPPPRTPC